MPLFCRISRVQPAGEVIVVPLPPPNATLATATLPALAPAGTARPRLVAVVPEFVLRPVPLMVLLTPPLPLLVVGMPWHGSDPDSLKVWPERARKVQS